MKMLDRMNTPKTRREFEHRLHLLREKMRIGKMHFAKGTGEGLLKVRYLPNGRIDLLSIDESTRLQANMTLQFESSQFQELMEEHEIDDEEN